MISFGQLESIANQLHSPNSPHLPYFLIRPSSDSYEISSSIIDYSTFFSSTPPSQRVVGFLDPSPLPQNPGWPLRNLLTFLRARYSDFVPSAEAGESKSGAGGAFSIRVLCWRDTDPPAPGKAWKSRFGIVEVPEEKGSSLGKGEGRPATVGWEKNTQGKLAPKVADLAPMMDPTRYGNCLLSDSE